MPDITTPPTGSFCWIELASSHPADSRQFYSALFEWQLTTQPMPDGSPYAMAALGGKNVCGITDIKGDAKKTNVPSHWLSYVAVANVDTSASQAPTLGGKILAPAKDVGPGRMAILQDPSGGVFALWQSRRPMGTWLYNEYGALCWNELVTSNVDAAGKFYASLFGWRTEARQIGKLGTYTIFNNGKDQAGGMMATPKDRAGTPSCWAVYFKVKGADQALARATKLGAKILAPMMDAPDVGRFAMLTDPQGASFGILEPS